MRRAILGSVLIAAALVLARQQVVVGAGRAKATFAGGCFWCMEGPFESLPGVLSVTSGYTGGEKKSPSYEEVSSGRTGHAEAVEIVYDPSRVTYEKLLDVFWHNIDPLTAGAQFCDRGSQYRSAVFFHDEEQRRAAAESKRGVEGRFGKAVATQVLPATAFYVAEEYHQDFHKKNPVRYKTYRLGCGRDRRLRELWGDEAGGAHASAGGAPKAKGSRVEFRKPSEEELRGRLTPLQYQVTQHEGTEPPFRNEYWDNKRQGIYVDVVSGEPLFSSLDKFDSGTGWPSFTRPLGEDNVKTRRDFKLVVPRTEARSAEADSHLGHVFRDGPAPTGLRYCINSAALRFIPVEKLAGEGYGEYLTLFGGAGRTAEKK